MAYSRRNFGNVGPEAKLNEDDAAQVDANDANIFETEGVETPDQLEAAPEVPDKLDDGFVVDDSLGPPGDGDIVRYKGADYIEGVPTRLDIIDECDELDGKNVSKTVRSDLDNEKQIFFMPTDVEEVNEYVNGNPVYTLRVFGATKDGSKTAVTITDIPVFFDVAVPDRPPTAKLLSAESQSKLVDLEPARISEFDSQLRRTLDEETIAIDRIETVKAYPVRGYNEETKPFKRIYTSNVQQRKKAIKAVRDAGMETASDDRSCYYRKAAREYGLPLSDWAVINDYEYTAGAATKNLEMCSHTIRVPVDGYRPLIDSMACKTDRLAGAAIKAKDPLLSKDRTLILTWDIETHGSRGTEFLPVGDREGDEAFMICVTAHWKDDPRAIKKICIVDVETAPNKDWTTVICGSPINVLKAFALVWKGFAPDINSGFNDSNYDWPFIVEKASHYKILGWMFHQMSAAPRYRQPTDSDVMKWNYRQDQRIKISPEDTYFSTYLKVPGCVPIDVRACYKKLYPKSETPKKSSLKFYLDITGLAGKADMPIKRMHNYYEAALETEGEPDPECAEHMRHVAHYCVIDALRCQQLLVRRNVINNYRGVSSLAFVSLYDSHYYAGGMKVCNLLAAYAWRRDMLVSMIPLERKESGKYPGAYVFPPEKGVSPDPDRLSDIETAAAALRDLMDVAKASSDESLYEDQIKAAKIELHEAFANFAHDRPVTGLDFSSLYPSLIMAYNLSPEKILLDEKEADYWRAQGRAIHPIEFPFNGRIVRGWSIRHNNVESDIGLYPSILIDLFGKRAAVKVVLKKHGAVKELIEGITSRAKKDGVSVAEAFRLLLADTVEEEAHTAAALAPNAPPPQISPGSTLEEEIADMKRLNKKANQTIKGFDRLRELACERAAEVDGGSAADATPSDGDIEAALTEEYERACFDHTCADTDQKALKVYMNTFYGEAGNSLSPFFLLPLAGGVTSAGQYNIKLVADFVTSKGFHIKYGDTDSLYLVIPDKYFADCDDDYAHGRISREDWWSAMVRITMRVMTTARDEVNAYLRADNGTGYLKMAYEEVLYPVVFTGKKKYFGIPHENEVNFRPKKLFIKGIDVVKQGQPELARTIGYRIMWGCVALDNSRSVLKITEDVLSNAVLNGAQWKFDDFIKTDAWKPSKNNIAVHRCIARMKARHAIEVAENDRLIAAGKAPKPLLYELPEPGERFGYVIVKTGASFDLRGRKSKLAKGDLMVFAKAARALGLEVDVSYYMVSYVVGLCARFVNGNEVFQPPAGGPPLTEKKVDEKSQKAAKKALENYLKSLNNIDSNTLRKRGYAYRRAFKAAAAKSLDALVESVGGGADVLQGEWLDFEVFGDEGEDDEVVDGVSKTVDTLWSSANSYADHICKDNIQTWCDDASYDLGIATNGANTRAEGATNLFKAASTQGPRVNRRRNDPAASCKRSFDRIESDIRKSIVEVLPAISDVAARYEADLTRLVNNFRLNEHKERPEIGSPEANIEAETDSSDALLGVTSDDAEILIKFRNIWFEAVGVQLARLRDQLFTEHLKQLKNRRLGVAPVPSRTERAKLVATSASKANIVGSIDCGI